tara:strand:+ start:962 stop:1234 length:273 start_codon:yes stop_codon:yes gene_type:complete
MQVSKPYEWDWETRETAQSVWFKQEDTLDDRGGLLIIRKDKRGRVSLYIASYGAGGFFERRFFSSDHGGAREARCAALQWIKAQHEGSAV